MKNLIQITQGEQAVSDDSDAVISTLLGSCVAVCLWDPAAKVGGMNHMLLTERMTSNQRDNSAGVNAMETLINGLMKEGAQRARLMAKVFGGAQMVPGLSDIGTSNGAFATQFLGRENIPIMGNSLGGTEARQVMFWPTTGAARLRVLGIQHAPKAPDVSQKTSSPAIDLF